MNLVAVVKRDCPTCALIEPVLKQLDAAADVSLEVVTQDDPAFPSGVADVQFDDDLSYSYHHDIETVPTLLRVDGGVEQSRLVGWKRDDSDRAQDCLTAHGDITGELGRAESHLVRSQRGRSEPL